MQNQRRKFIATASLVVGGAALGGARLLAGTQPASEEDVLKTVAAYGSHQETVRNGSDVSLTVKMHSPEAFCKVFNAENGLPFENIYAGSDNTLSFELSGTRFTLRNVA